jgi:hypothetical protein
VTGLGGRKRVVCGEHGVGREAGQRRERQVVAELEVIGEHHAQAPGAQLGDEFLLPGLDHLKGDCGMAPAKPLAQPRHHQRRHGDQAAEVQRATHGGSLPRAPALAR